VFFKTDNYQETNEGLYAVIGLASKRFPDCIDVGICSFEIVDEEDEATACLIAAAPELLEELQHAQTIIRQLQHMLYHRGVDDTAEWPSLREQNRLSIIAQARGLKS
jgi:hypothetical protein